MRKRVFGAALAFWFIATTAIGQESALKGNDVVAYHTENRAILGSQEFNQSFQNQTYLFTNAEHQQQFSANPGRYLPLFAGYCTYAMSQNKKVIGDPKVFITLEGKLYFFKDSEAKNQWLRQAQENIQLGERHWQSLKN